MNRSAPQTWFADSRIALRYQRAPVHPQITLVGEGAVLVGEDDDVVAKHDEKVTDLLAVPTGRSSVAVDARVAPEREERARAQPAEVALGVGNAVLLRHGGRRLLHGHLQGALYPHKTLLIVNGSLLRVASGPVWSAFGLFKLRVARVGHIALVCRTEAPLGGRGRSCRRIAISSSRSSWSLLLMRRMCC